MEGELVALQYAKGVSYDNVRHEDRGEVERIITGLVAFEKKMPRLQIDIYDAGDHYLISVKGYNHTINFDKFYRVFRGDASPYPFIQGVVFTPSTGVFTIDVKKRDFSESKLAAATTVTMFAEPTPPSAPRKSRSRSRSRSRSTTRSRSKSRQHR